jgi:hypothetical protein
MTKILGDEPSLRESAGKAGLATALTFWEKRTELSRLNGLVARIRADIREIEQARLRASFRRLPPHQRLVIWSMVNDDWHDEQWFSNFGTISGNTGLTRAQVSRACKALRRLGFVEFQAGLFNEDGGVAGAGYRVSKDGHDWWREHEAQPGNRKDGASPQNPEAA